MAWFFYAVMDRLTRNKITYGAGDKVAFDNNDPEVGLLQSLGVLGDKTGSAPNPMEEATASLPDPGILPGNGFLHRDNAGNYTLKNQIAAEDF